jgi:hypothetical protein
MPAVPAPEPVPFRRPSDRAALYAWHAAALAAIEGCHVSNLREVSRLDPERSPPVQEGRPECGWFLAHVARQAVPVPARIYLRSEIDEGGELISDEVLVCELGGEVVDVMEAWPRLCLRPINRSDFAYRMAVRGWAQTSAPDQPQAQTGRRIDWLTVQLPEVPKG